MLMMLFYVLSTNDLARKLYNFRGIGTNSCDASDCYGITDALDHDTWYTRMQDTAACTYKAP